MNATQKRNYGIDLLRTVSMLMVVVLHLLGHGGVLKSLGGDVTVKYSVAWFLEAAFACAVNCYALISGYVGVNANPDRKYKNIFKLYLNVIFYAVLISAGFRLFVPDSTSWTYVLQSFLPFWFNTYWYYTAYFCLSFFMPYINMVINSLNRKKMMILTAIILVFFSLVPVVFQKDLYFLKDGYSLLWLALLYVVGGCLSKMNLAEKFKKWHLGLLYLLPVIIAWVANIIVRVNGVKGLESDFLIKYISPCMVVSAIALVLLFSKIKIKKKSVKNTIKLFAASSFSVYLVHDHPLVRKYLIDGSMQFVTHLPTIGMVGVVLGISVAIYLVCSGIDFVRIGIFKLVEKGIKKVRLHSKKC